jgi:flagellar hook-length control protein FliK
MAAAAEAATAGAATLAAAAGVAQAADTAQAASPAPDGASAALPDATGGADSAPAAGPAAAAAAPPGAVGLALAGGGGHAHAGANATTVAGNAADAAAAVSQANSAAAPPAPTAAAAVPILQVHASIDGAGFAQGLADRVSWMFDNGVNGAKLQINPPQLGPIELRIAVQGDHALISMITHSAVARDALESSSPLLREMLNAHGFGQVSVDISQRSFQERTAYTPRYERHSPAGGGTVVTPTASGTAAAAPRIPQGALDAYA